MTSCCNNFPISSSFTRVCLPVHSIAIYSVDPTEYFVLRTSQQDTVRSRCQANIMAVKQMSATLRVCRRQEDDAIDTPGTMYSVPCPAVAVAVALALASFACSSVRCSRYTVVLESQAESVVSHAQISMSIIRRTPQAQTYKTALRSNTCTHQAAPNQPLAVCLATLQYPRNMYNSDTADPLMHSQSYRCI